MNLSVPAVARPPLAFAASRTPPRTAWTLLLTLCLSVLLQGRDVRVPFIPGDAVVRTSPLLPVLLAVPLLAMTATRLSVVEEVVRGRRLPVLRTAWALLLAGTCAALSALAAATGDGASAGLAAADALSFVGLGLVCSAVLGADLSWLGPTLLAVLTFFLGKDRDNEVRSWAWMLHPDLAGPALVGGVLLLVCGCVTFTAWDGTGRLARRTLG